LAFSDISRIHLSMLTNSRMHLSMFLGERSRSLRIPTERHSKIKVRLDFQPNEVRLLVIAIASNIIKQHRRHSMRPAGMAGVVVVVVHSAHVEQANHVHFVPSHALFLCFFE